MRTKYTAAPAALVLTVSMVLGAVQPAYAQDAMAAETLPSLAPAPASAPAVAAPASTDPSSTQVFVPAASATGTSTLPGAAPVGTSALGASPMGGVPGAAPGTGGIMQSPTTPQIVTDAVNGLQGTNPINLDDMIRAQDAINRLDLMLEIEKRQTELKKLRDERNKPTTALGASIPASALSLPPMTASPPPRIRSSDEEGGDEGGSGFSSSSSSGGIDKYSLKRITGSDGKYAAVLDNGTKVISVRPGDKLSDDVKIKSVTLTAVTLTKGKKTKTLSVPTDSYIVRETSSLNQ